MQKNPIVFSQEDREAFLISHWYFVLGKSLVDIANILGISHATVGRRIKYAEEKKWIKTSFSPPSEYEGLMHYLLSVPGLVDELKKRFKGYIEEIIVVPKGKNESETRENVIRMAAFLVEMNLDSIECIGFNWGYTTLSLVRTLTPSKPRHHLVCVPIFGLLGLTRGQKSYRTPSTYESTRITSLFAEKVQSLEPISVTFRAFIPETFENSQDIKKYIEDDVTYQEIFGQKLNSNSESSSANLFYFESQKTLQEKLDNTTFPLPDELLGEFKKENIELSNNSIISVKVKGAEWRVADNQQVFVIKKDGNILSVLKPILMEELDSIVTSIGTLDHRSLWYRFASRSPEDTLQELKDARIIGDIGQKLVTIKGLDEPVNEKIEKINNRVVGLRPEKHFRNLSEKHRIYKKGMGLCVMSDGRRKARITISTILSRLPNILIIDEDLAIELIKIHDNELSRQKWFQDRINNQAP